MKNYDKIKKEAIQWIKDYFAINGPLVMLLSEFLAVKIARLSLPFA